MSQLMSQNVKTMFVYILLLHSHWLDLFSLCHFTQWFLLFGLKGEGMKLLIFISFRCNRFVYNVYFVLSFFWFLLFSCNSVFLPETFLLYIYIQSNLVIRSPVGTVQSDVISGVTLYAIKENCQLLDTCFFKHEQS